MIEPQDSASNTLTHHDELPPEADHAAWLILREVVRRRDIEAIKATIGAQYERENDHWVMWTDTWMVCCAYTQYGMMDENHITDFYGDPQRFTNDLIVLKMHLSN